MNGVVVLMSRGQCALVAATAGGIVVDEDDRKEHERGPKPHDMLEHDNAAPALKNEARNGRPEEDTRGVKPVVNRIRAAVILRLDDRAGECERDGRHRRECRAGDENDDAHRPIRIEEDETEYCEKARCRQSSHRLQVSDLVGYTSGNVRAKKHAQAEQSRENGRTIFCKSF